MTTEIPMLDSTPALPTSLPTELTGPARHGVRWPVVATIAIVAAGAGVFGGSRLLGSDRAAAPAAMPGVAAPDAVPAPPPGAGSNAVYVSLGRQQLVGVRSAAIGRQRVEGMIRTEGMLEYDETRTVQVHTRVSGWVEQLFVDYVGKPVHRGQALFAVYSPDLATAQADYLVALRAQQQATTSGGADAKTSADALLVASRERMKRWDVSDAQIAELERVGHPTRTMTIASPFDGVVLEKNAFAGQYVTPDMTSFKLSDLSQIWAIGQVFEYEAASIHVGDAIDVEFPYGQTAKLEAKIDFIYPEVDPVTRRVRFRVLLPNAERKLKPSTYVTLVWHGAAVDRLVIPTEAVIDTGVRKYVLLALADGYFEPRDVQIGPPIGELYPVLAGVVEGEHVVTSAQFMIDSESNLMSAMQGMAATMPGMAPSKPAQAAGSAVPAMPAMKGM